MPRIDGTTDRQSTFLRAFHLHPAGPPPEAWPSPAILRRWLRHDGFRRAFTDLQRTLKTILSFQSLTTGLAAAQSLHDSLTTPQPTPSAPSPADSNLTPEPQTLAPEPQTLNPSAEPQTLNPSGEPRTLTPAQRLELHRERLRNRTALTFLRLAHARLRKPPLPRRPLTEPQKPKADDELDPNDDYTGLTPEQIAIRLAHPNCRPEVAIANFRRDLHPFYDEHEYDMTTNPPTLVRLNPRCPTPPLYPPAKPAAPEHPGDHPAPDQPAAATASAGT